MIDVKAETVQQRTRPRPRPTGAACTADNRPRPTSGPFSGAAEDEALKSVSYGGASVHFDVTISRDWSTRGCM